MVALVVLGAAVVVVVAFGALATRREAEDLSGRERFRLEPRALPGAIRDQVDAWEAHGLVASAQRVVTRRSDSIVVVLTDVADRFDIRLLNLSVGDSLIQSPSVVSYFPNGRLTTSANVGLAALSDEIVQASFGSDLATLVVRHRSALEALRERGVRPLEHDGVTALDRFDDETDAELRWVIGHPVRQVKAVFVVVGSLLRVRRYAAPIRGERRVARIGRKLAGSRKQA